MNFRGKIMKNEDLSRLEAEQLFDELLKSQKSGSGVTLSQIQEADNAWQEAAQRENLAALHHRLYAVGSDFELLAEQRKKAREALKKLLHKKDEINQLTQKIELYLEGVNHRLNVAAVEESEVLALLDEVQK
jgi:cob(I)alamin adenosyltransferase